MLLIFLFITAVICGSVISGSSTVLLGFIPTLGILALTLDPVDEVRTELLIIVYSIFHVFFAIFSYIGFADELNSTPFPFPLIVKLLFVAFCAYMAYTAHLFYRILKLKSEEQ